jgi:hypothetical protein
VVFLQHIPVPYPQIPFRFSHLNGLGKYFDDAGQIDSPLIRFR